MSFRSFAGAAVATFALAHVSAHPAAAQPITDPTAAYLAGTTKLAIPYAPGARVSSVSTGSGAYTATFRDLTNAALSLQGREHDPSLDPSVDPPADRPYTWATWNRRPASEFDGSYILPVAYTEDGNFVRFALSQPTTLFGFEAEPDLLDDASPMTANFFFDNVLVGSVTRTVNGTAGALLFAFQNAAGVDRVDFSTPPGIAFAVADVRASVTPEPATLLLLGAGLAGVGAAARRRRRAD